MSDRLEKTTPPSGTQKSISERIREFRHSKFGRVFQAFIGLSLAVGGCVIQHQESRHAADMYGSIPRVEETITDPEILTELERAEEMIRNLFEKLGSANPPSATVQDSPDAQNAYLRDHALLGYEPNTNIEEIQGSLCAAHVVLKKDSSLSIYCNAFGGPITFFKDGKGKYQSMTEGADFSMLLSEADHGRAVDILVTQLAAILFHPDLKNKDGTHSATLPLFVTTTFLDSGERQIRGLDLINNTDVLARFFSIHNQELVESGIEDPALNELLFTLDFAVLSPDMSWAHLTTLYESGNLVLPDGLTLEDLAALIMMVNGQGVKTTLQKGEGLIGTHNALDGQLSLRPEIVVLPMLNDSEIWEAAPQVETFVFHSHNDYEIINREFSDHQKVFGPFTTSATVTEADEISKFYLASNPEAQSPARIELEISTWTVDVNGATIYLRRNGQTMALVPESRYGLPISYVLVDGRLTENHANPPEIDHESSTRIALEILAALKAGNGNQIEVQLQSTFVNGEITSVTSVGVDAAAKQLRLIYQQYGIDVSDVYRNSLVDGELDLQKFNEELIKLSGTDNLPYLAVDLAALALLADGQTIPTNAGLTFRLSSDVTNVTRFTKLIGETNFAEQ